MGDVYGSVRPSTGSRVSSASKIAIIPVNTPAMTNEEPQAPQGQPSARSHPPDSARRREGEKKEDPPPFTGRTSDGEFLFVKLYMPKVAPRRSDYCHRDPSFFKRPGTLRSPIWVGLPLVVDLLGDYRALYALYGNKDGKELLNSAVAQHQFDGAVAAAKAAVDVSCAQDETLVELSTRVAFSGVFYAIECIDSGLIDSAIELLKKSEILVKNLPSRHPQRASFLLIVFLVMATAYRKFTPPPRGLTAAGAIS
jgi:hypothetical protein